MQNVAVLRMLGECLTRCHLKMWSLGPPYLEDVPCMGMVGKHFEWMCEEGAQPNDIYFVCLLSACSHPGLVDEGRCLYASMMRD
jgi:hypothetical protein